jgi:hypothetical protein
MKDCIQEEVIITPVVLHIQNSRRRQSRRTRKTTRERQFIQRNRRRRRPMLLCLTETRRSCILKTLTLKRDKRNYY